LTGTNNGGIIIVGLYLDEPQTEVKFSSGEIKGGTGKPWIKFIGVRVEGSTLGTARVTIHYTDAEVRNIEADSLFISYFSGGSWHTCANIGISAENHTVSGDIPVSRLSGTAIGLGGTMSKQNEATAGAIMEDGSGQITRSIPWVLAGGIVIGTTVVVGGIILVLEAKRRREAANS
jgi:hypothetical protein